MEEEQVYTVPLREVRKAKSYKRSARAVNIVKDFVEKHENADEIRITSDLNEKIWDQGAENPPSKIRIRVTKEADGVVEVSSLE